MRRSIVSHFLNIFPIASLQHIDKIRQVRYVDGFVLIVQKKNIPAYTKMAKEGAKLWMKYGALDYKECVGEDLRPGTDGMKVWTFPKMLKLKPSETAVFSYIVYKSKAHRNSVNKKVMKDPSMTDQNKNQKMPFDMKKMAYGGFQVLVDAK